MIDFKVNKHEIVCLTNQDKYKAVYIYNLEREKLAQTFNFRNQKLLNVYGLRSVAVSAGSRFMLLAGWTKKEEGAKEYPFVSFFSKEVNDGRSEYVLKGTTVLSNMSTTITALEFMPKKQNNFIFFMAIDFDGNLGIYRTDQIRFEQVFFKERFHEGKIEATLFTFCQFFEFLLIFVGRVNCLDFDYNMRLITCSDDCSIKSAVFYPN